MVALDLLTPDCGCQQTRDRSLNGERNEGLGLRTVIVKKGVPIHTGRGGHSKLGTFQCSRCSSYIRCSLLGLLFWQGVCKAQVLQEVPAHALSPSAQHQQHIGAECHGSAGTLLSDRWMLPS